MKIFTLLIAILITGIAANAHALPINVALGSMVTISSTPVSGTSPSNIVDGDYMVVTTNSISQIRGLGWWQVNLDYVQQIDQIALYFVGVHPGNGINYTMTAYTISYKQNSSDPWTQITAYSGSLKTDPIYTHVYDFETPILGRYFQLNVVGSAWGDPVLNEFQLNQLDDPEPESTVPEPASIILSLLGTAGLVIKKIKGNPNK